MDKHLVIITGATAVGKTNLSITLAQQLPSEIISCDSRQFFREMNIGTAKPSDAELSAVKHHFINNLSIEEEYNVGRFEAEALAKITELHEKYQVVLMVGGSGLYIRAVCEGLDDFPTVPVAIRDQLRAEYETHGLVYIQQQLQKMDEVHYEQMDNQNPQRILRALEVCIASGRPYSSFRKQNDKPKRPFKITQIILERDREKLYDRINKRVDLMMENGLLAEVKELYPYKQLNALQTVGYKELFDFLDAKTDLPTAIELIKRNTRRYAKRQLTWLRKQTNAHRFAAENEVEVLGFVKEFVG